jgi:hypothetical protein
MTRPAWLTSSHLTKNITPDALPVPAHAGAVAPARHAEVESCAP